MFEVEPILWLQQFSGETSAGFMWLMSELGRDWVFMPVSMVLMFGLRLKPGMGVILALVLTGFVTVSIKHGFALPRPADVDVRVVDKGEAVRALVADGGGEQFWSLPSDEAIAAVRAQQDPSFGFVSGHTSSAVTLMLAVALFFSVRLKSFWALVFIWPLLMGLSRMYLGRHFLADVLGGLAVGALLTIGAFWLWRMLVRGDRTARRLEYATLGFGALLTVFASQIPWLSPGAAGQIVGAILCFMLFNRRGWPDDAASLPRRVARVLLAFAVATLVDIAAQTGYAASGLGDAHIAAGVVAASGFVIALCGSAWLCKALRLYPARQPVDAVQ